MRYNILYDLTRAFNLPNSKFATKLVLFKNLVGYYNVLATSLNFEPGRITTFLDVAKFTLEKLCSAIGSKLEDDSVKLTRPSNTALLECSRMAGTLSTKKFIVKFIFTDFPYENRIDINNQDSEQVRRYFQCKKHIDELLSAGGDAELNMSIEDIRNEIVAAAPLVYLFMFRFCSIYSYFHLNDLAMTKIPIIRLTSELTVDHSPSNMYILYLNSLVSVAYGKLSLIESSTDKVAKLKEIAERILAVNDMPKFEQTGCMALSLASMVSKLVKACMDLFNENTLPFVIVPMTLMTSTMKKGNPKSFLNIHKSHRIHRGNESWSLL